MFPNVPWASSPGQPLGLSGPREGGAGGGPPQRAPVPPQRARSRVLSKEPPCAPGPAGGEGSGPAQRLPPVPEHRLCVVAPVLGRESKVRKSRSGEAGGHPQPRPGPPSVSFPRVGGAGGWWRYAPPCGGAGRTVSPALPRLPEPLNVQKNVFPRGRGRWPQQRRALSVEAQVLACGSADHRLKMRQRS